MILYGTIFCDENTSPKLTIGRAVRNEYGVAETSATVIVELGTVALMMSAFQAWELRRQLDMASLAHEMTLSDLHAINQCYAEDRQDS